MKPQAGMYFRNRNGNILLVQEITEGQVRLAVFDRTPDGKVFDTGVGIPVLERLWEGYRSTHQLEAIPDPLRTGKPTIQLQFQMTEPWDHGTPPTPDEIQALAHCATEAIRARLSVLRSN